MADEIDLETLAQQPKAVKTDEGEVESHSLGDLVDAARFVGGRLPSGSSPFASNKSRAISKGPRG